jgi:hypothetical protein
MVIVATHAFAQTASWLDRPMSGWNKPGVTIPQAPPGAESRDALARRCSASAASKVSPAAAAALAKSGWTPFLHLDQQIQRDGVEVVGGMNAAGSSCEAKTFNLFVFVGGAFAGTLSPGTMTVAQDGVARAVRVTGKDALTAEFSRYQSADLECCPSSRVRVSYTIDRAGGRPAVVATEVRQIR